MLINKGITVGEVVTIKTTAGEEIVAKLVEENPMAITVSKPLVLTASQKGIALVPFLFTTSPDANITINRATVMVLAPTDKDASDTYIQNTTGIKLASA
jgi:hypothetical protein